MTSMQLRRSVLITLLSSNSSTLVMFGVSVVMARLLSPAEIGVFSVAVVFINIVAVFRDFGIGSYLVREEHLTPAKVRSALGLVLCASWLLAIGLYFGSAPVAAFYGQSGIADVMRVLTLSFLLVPYAAVLSALLMRDMAAGKNAFVNAVSTLVFAGTCLGLAWLGFSYMAMAWANVANLLTNIICFLYVRPKGYVLVPLFSGWRHPMKFGTGAILGNLITTINQSIPDLVLGKVAGVRDVGLYSRANGLVGIFQQVAGPAVNYNALPFIAKNYHAKVPLGPMLATSSSYLTGLAWPAYIVAAVFAKELIEVLYGPQWLEAGPLVVVLCISAAMRTGYTLNQAALLAIDRPYVAAASSAANLVARLALLSLLFIPSLAAQNLLAFAIAISMADVISIPISAWLMSKYLGYSTKASLAAHRASLKVCTVCLAVALLARALLPTDWPAYVLLMAAAGLVLGVWLSTLRYFHHPLTAELKRIFNANQ